MRRVRRVWRVWWWWRRRVERVERVVVVELRWQQDGLLVCDGRRLGLPFEPRMRMRMTRRMKMRRMMRKRKKKVASLFSRGRTQQQWRQPPATGWDPFPTPLPLQAHPSPLLLSHLLPPFPYPFSKQQQQTSAPSVTGSVSALWGDDNDVDDDDEVTTLSDPPPPPPPHHASHAMMRLTPHYRTASLDHYFICFMTFV